VLITYPSPEDEVKVLHLVRGEEAANAPAGEDGGGAESPTQGSAEGSAAPGTEPDLISQDAVFQARDEILDVHIADSIERYIIDLITATRTPERYSEELASWIEVGASPRGGIGLDRVSRAHAWLNGRDHVTPEDVQAIAHDVLRHRIMLTYEASASGVTADQVVAEVLKLVAVA
jgi:MoxR-like ATPase